jgi:peptide/nickel transport system ATP-binding protein
MSVAPLATADPAAVRPVLEGRELTKYFSVKRSRRIFSGESRLFAVDRVSVALAAGTVTALVGESGSGKTTVARMLCKIINPDGGEVLLDGEPVPKGRPRSYARQVQMVFQDPFASLNPIHRVRYDLLRPLKIHGLGGEAPDQAVAELLHRVHLDPAEQYMSKFPHELSGGQRQRVAIARALAVEPRVLLADEPVSMLDVSIRLGLLNLLADLRDREHLAILYVTHDIISVMYAGQLVETAPSTRLTDSPAHPYTQLLLSAAPDPDRIEPPSLAGSGAPPSLIAPPSGCRFHPRCPHAMAICSAKAPPSVTVSPGHVASCWLHVDPSQRGVEGDGQAAGATTDSTYQRPVVASNDKHHLEED